MPFPSNFTWGAATAAYQIEGAAHEDGRAPSVWDAFCDRPGAVFEGHTGDTACDHYHRLEEDVALMADLGLQAYRFSLAWPRILPAGDGPPNTAGLDFYDRLVDALLAHNIQPWVTLFHWDLPLELHHRGGWRNPDIPHWFENYTTAAVQRLGDRVQHWITFNEPQIFLHVGHQLGIHAPGERLDTPALVTAAHRCLLAHGRAVAAIRAHSRAKPNVGFTVTGIYPYPTTRDDATVDAARRAFLSVTKNDWAMSTTWLADPVFRGEYPADGLEILGQFLPANYEQDLATIHQPLDFLGLNCYQGKPHRIDSAGNTEEIKRIPGYPQTMLHWPVDPDVLEWGLRFLHERYPLPIYVTENGCANMDWVHADGHVHDPQRIDFVTRYLVALRRAIDAGADVRGYFHWSLMDNFEWSVGYQMRFGLVHVDYETLQRTPKDSYAWYQNLIRTNAANLPPDLDWHY
jgi:beta-glucosidase